MANKVVELEELSTLVADGDRVALGGGWFANHPMAAVRQLVRDQRRDLEAITIVGSVDIDLLLAADSLRHVTFSMVTLEAFGLAPHFRQKIEAGEVSFTEMTGLGLLIALEAQGRGVPFLPYRGPFGSDLPGHYPDQYAEVDCPFTGERLTATRAIQPDVAIVHALRADPEGNAQWDGTSAADVEMAKAAKRVVITCEEVVDRDTIVANAHMTKVPGYYVDAVIEAPFGAHPCTHVPAYGLDAWRIKDYVAATAEGFDGYLDAIRSETEADYRKRVVGEDRMPVLRGLVDQAQVLTPANR